MWHRTVDTRPDMPGAGQTMIVVTGATGTIGRELVPLLAGRGTAVRALSRRPWRGEDLSGVEWLEVDLADRDALERTCAGAEGFFLLTGNTDAMVQLQHNAIRAAAEAGVAHVVKVSALGASEHSKAVIGLWHHNVERFLRTSGVPWTVLRPHHFMQNLLDPAVFDRNTGIVYSSSGEGRIPFIDARDIAEVARVVLTESGHEGQVYTLTGPQAVSYRHATEVLSGVLDRDLAYVPEDVDDAWRRLRAAGQPPWLVGSLLAIAAYQRAGGPTERVTDTVQRLTGSAARDLEQFARDHLPELVRQSR